MTRLHTLLFLGAVACSGENKVEVQNPLTNKYTTPQELPKAPTPFREYCVLATDDATVADPVGFANQFLDGQRFSDSPYENYSNSTRVPTETYTIGTIPDGVFENEYPSEFMVKVNTLCHHDYDTMNGRAKFIFTGPKFDKQKLEPYRYLGFSPDKFNGLEWTIRHTKAGHILETEHEGTKVSIIYLSPYY